MGEAVMNTQALWRDQEKIRQQFDYGPYPRIPLEQSPKEDFERLFEDSLVTAYYLRHRKVVDTRDKLILDAGCGSGYTSLVLATANPGAKIIGVDLSEQSLDLARQRLEYHGIKDAEFHQLKLEEVEQLGYQFDYINCDEMLYLLPDPADGLRAMKSVLKPDGIIHSNLHSIHQRKNFYRAQELFKYMGLMDSNPEAFEEEAVVETMKALQDGVRLKAETWNKANETIEPEKLQQVLAMNFLFIGDTGFTIPDMFDLIRQADLDFVSMVNWRQWDVVDLFKDADELPLLWSMSLANATIEEKLHLFELLHPIHRLLDFWCTHPGEVGIPVDEWEESDWRQATVHLHPHLRTHFLKDGLTRCIQEGKGFEISQAVPGPALKPILLEPTTAACLFPLWDSPQPIQALAERYRTIRPVDPITLEPLTPEDAFTKVKDLLNRLDAFLYVLLERT